MTCVCMSACLCVYTNTCDICMHVCVCACLCLYVYTWYWEFVRTVYLAQSGRRHVFAQACIHLKSEYCMEKCTNRFPYQLQSIFQRMLFFWELSCRSYIQLRCLGISQHNVTENLASVPGFLTDAYPDKYIIYYVLSHVLHGLENTRYVSLL